MPATVFSSPRYAPGQGGVPVAEASLHRVAADLAEVLVPERDGPLFVIPELDLGGVRPDLWVGYFDPDIFSKRYEHGIDPCTAPQPLAVAYTLRRLGGESTVDRLSAPRFGLGDRRRVQRGIAELVERGCAVRDGSSIELSTNWESARPAGVGVEAKMGRWRKAVRQVQMWRGFVNAAWLVFPSSYLDRVPRNQPGVRDLGLAVVEGERGRIIRRPRWLVGRAFSRMLAEEHLYARWRREKALRAGSAAVRG